ncbi:MAG: hypothetical protein ACK4RS_05970, partial [Thiothrix sp.]
MLATLLNDTGITMLFTALTAALEAAFNTWLQLDQKTHGQALERLRTWEGKLIGLHLQNPELTLYFLPNHDGVH